MCVWTERHVSALCQTHPQPKPSEKEIDRARRKRREEQDGVGERRARGETSFTARAPEMMPKTEGRLRISHSVVIQDSEPVAAEIWEFRHAKAACAPALPAIPLPPTPHPLCLVKPSS